ncbi:MAG: non-canonical purine NTP pyrophosphatase [Erysipelotrichaceae bacterium]|nr:non-canonical purine NTP pyrophosphatase [Erysipelotrichaceae bacterium]
MRVLLGTTNPSKVKRFKDLLNGYDVEFLTLKDLKITSEPKEIGNTPEENAIIKAKYYSAYFDIIICNDSGLYFEELDILDKRQPGLNIRTPIGDKRLNDDEMIDYYSKLVESLGGKVSAYYLDGIAVYNKGKIFSFMDNQSSTKTDSFYMVSTPSIKRHIGWPLDSISIVKSTNLYFVDSKESESKDNIFVNEYRKKITKFLVESLNL